MIIVQDRFPNGICLVTAKFQVVSVPTITDKVVIMKWHQLTARQPGYVSESHAAERKHATPDAHHSKAHATVAIAPTEGQVAAAAAGGCVWAQRKPSDSGSVLRNRAHRRSQVTTDSPSAAIDERRGVSVTDKHNRLRFDAGADRRYSATAKPLHEPRPLTIKRGHHGTPTVDDSNDEDFYIKDTITPPKPSAVQPEGALVLE
jgi:hypothetical protein